MKKSNFVIRNDNKMNNIYLLARTIDVVVGAETEA